MEEQETRLPIWGPVSKTEVAMKVVTGSSSHAEGEPPAQAQPICRLIPVTVTVGGGRQGRALLSHLLPLSQGTGSRCSLTPRGPACLGFSGHGSGRPSRPASHLGGLGQAAFPPRKDVWARDRGDPGRPVLARALWATGKPRAPSRLGRVATPRDLGFGTARGSRLLQLERSGWDPSTSERP